MSALPKPHWTPRSYLAFELASEVRHKYIDGEVYAMTGVSRQHNLIVTNTLAALHSQLAQRPCEVYPSDMRVKMSTVQYAYPDISVICGEPQFGEEKPDTLLNPIILIEVLSPSTEDYDRGKKTEGYRTMSSLQEYILISQERYHIEHYVRQTNSQWLLTELSQIDGQIQLASIQCALFAAELYHKITLA